MFALVCLTLNKLAITETLCNFNFRCVQGSTTAIPGAFSCAKTVLSLLLCTFQVCMHLFVCASAFMHAHLHMCAQMQ